MVRMTAQNSAAACTFFSSSIAVSDAAHLLPTSGVSSWGVAVVLGSAYSPADSFALVWILSVSSACVICCSPIVALGSFGMWCVSPPCCVYVFCVSGDFCCWWFRSVKSWGFVISFRGSYGL